MRTVASSATSLRVPPLVSVAPVLLPVAPAMPLIIATVAVAIVATSVLLVAAATTTAAAVVFFTKATVVFIEATTTTMFLVETTVVFVETTVIFVKTTAVVFVKAASVVFVESTATTVILVEATVIFVKTTTAVVFVKTAASVVSLVEITTAALAVVVSFTASSAVRVVLLIATTSAAVVGLALVATLVVVVFVASLVDRWFRNLPLILFLLPLLVVDKVVKDGSGVSVAVHHPQHLQAPGVRHLLGVSRIGHGLVLVVLQADVTQLDVGHVLDVDPAHFELPFPLVLRPHAGVGIVVHGAHHLGHAAEVSAPVDGEEQINDALFLFAFAESRVEAFVTVFRAAPDFVLDAAVDVIFRVGFDDKEACVGSGQVKLGRVVVVLDFEFVEDGVRDEGDVGWGWRRRQRRQHEGRGRASQRARGGRPGRAALSLARRPTRLLHRLLDLLLHLLLHLLGRHLDLDIHSNACGRILYYQFDQLLFGCKKPIMICINRDFSHTKIIK